MFYGEAKLARLSMPVQPFVCCAEPTFDLCSWSSVSLGEFERRASGLSHPRASLLGELRVFLVCRVVLSVFPKNSADLSSILLVGKSACFLAYRINLKD